MIQTDKSYTGNQQDYLMINFDKRSYLDQINIYKYFLSIRSWL